MELDKKYKKRVDVLFNASRISEEVKQYLFMMLDALKISMDAISEDDVGIIQEIAVFSIESVILLDKVTVEIKENAHPFYMKAQIKSLSSINKRAKKFVAENISFDEVSKFCNDAIFDVTNMDSNDLFQHFIDCSNEVISTLQYLGDEISKGNIKKESIHFVKLKIFFLSVLKLIDERFIKNSGVLIFVVLLLLTMIALAIYGIQGVTELLQEANKLRN